MCFRRRPLIISVELTTKSTIFTCLTPNEAESLVISGIAKREPRTICDAATITGDAKKGTVNSGTKELANILSA